MVRAWALTSMLLAATPPQHGGITPTEQVKATVDQVLSIVRQHRPSEDEKLEQVIGRRFDFAQMAQRSLGPRWREITPVQRTDFIRIFTELLKQTYLDQIKAYNNQKVVFTGERQDGRYAEVETRIVPEDGEPISINYRLQNNGGDWKVYDLVIENVSVVNNYRSQFSRVLTNNSFPELIRRMKNKERH